MTRLASFGLPPARRLAIAAGAAIGVLGVFGAVDLLAPSWPLSVFSLEGEHTIPAAFSAAILLGAGVLAWLVSAEDQARVGSPALWRFMGAFFVFMALDELFAIHERVSTPVTGVSWQVVYAPVILAAVIAWSVVMKRLPSDRVRLMWAGGAAAWFLSQVIEAVQWDGDRLVYAWTFVPEEMLEMTGSLLWGLALMLVVMLPDEEDQAKPEAAAEQAADPRLQGRRRRRMRGPGRKSEAPESRTPSAR